MRLHDLAHVPATAGLAALAFTALRSRVSSRGLLLTAVAASTMAVGLGVEIVQLIAGTGDFQLRDLGYDLIGTVIGVAIAWLLRDVRVPITVAVIVVGVAMAVVALPGPEPDFDYASAAVEHRCRTGDDVAAAPHAVDVDPVVLYRLDEGAGDHVVDAADGLDVSIGRPDAVTWVPGGLEFDGRFAEAMSADAATSLAAAVARTDEFSVEVWMTPTSLPQDGPARVVTVSEGTERGESNFHLGVEGGAASFRIRTDCDDFNWTLTDDVFEVGHPTHVVASYRPGHVDVFVDGETAISEPVEVGALDAWDPSFHLHLGDEATGDRGYAGELDRVAIYDVALDENDAAARHEAGSDTR